MPLVVRPHSRNCPRPAREQVIATVRRHLGLEYGIAFPHRSNIVDTLDSPALKRGQICCAEHGRFVIDLTLHGCVEHISQELQEPSAATDIPVLSLEETDAESSDDQIASLDDTNLEPIEAIEWPDPDQADTVVQVLDVDQDETYVPVLDTDAEDDADDREDADASLTGA